MFFKANSFDFTTTVCHILIRSMFPVYCVASFCVCVCAEDTTEVCGVALKRPASQISVYTDGTVYYTADIGNDGLFDDPDDWNDPTLATWTASLFEHNPWWMVDLGFELSVTEVILTNRKHAGKVAPLLCGLSEFHRPTRVRTFLANLTVKFKSRQIFNHAE